MSKNGRDDAFSSHSKPKFVMLDQVLERLFRLNSIPAAPHTIVRTRAQPDGDFGPKAGYCVGPVTREAGFPG
jgi:hypothetical protein